MYRNQKMPAEIKGRIQMKVKSGALLALLVVIAMYAVQSSAQAQVTAVPLFVTQYNDQTGANTVVFDQYAFSERLQETNAGDVTGNITLDYPGSGSPATYAAPTGSSTAAFYSPSGFSSVADLEASYPHGDYTTSYTGPSISGSDTVNWTTDAFPTSTPQFDAGSYNALQGLNASTSVTLNWNAFTGALSGGDNNGLVFLDIYNASTNASVFNDDFAPSSTTSAYLSGGTLAAGTSYYAVLDYSNRLGSTDANGVNTSVGFDNSTTLDFTTAAAPAPEASSIVSMAVLLCVGLLGMFLVHRKQNVQI
jgi:hypothetical protein